ncbi:MAG TPA: hypothetical protein VKQ72_00405 [Aggregatilineales bacterium]|nr:hypothetical protein [Aggregatilineales bacterium]
MRRDISPSIAPSEWRWVIIFSGLLVAITLLPYAWAFASNSPSDYWVFMGILVNPKDEASYLAKINEGAQGAWLFTLPYTAENQTGAAINEFYLLLGHIARLTGLSSLLMFHISRLVTGFVMYLSFYYLGSVIWPRLRPRRLFFSLLAVGSGLGWLYLVLFGRVAAPATISTSTDFVVPESIPFYSTFTNPHFPLAIALIALLAAYFVTAFRPGFEDQPGFANGGLTVAALTIALAIVQPQGLVPIAAGLCVYVVVLAIHERRIPWREINWVTLVILPASPFFVYYFALTLENPAIRIWNAQNNTPSPPIINYLFGFGLLLIVAIPGIIRAIRHFERDGDQFMVVWLIVNALALYAPTNIQRRFAIGLIIPVVYFAVRALEDYWFHRIKVPWRDAALVALYVFIVPSNILALSIPLFAVFQPSAGIKAQSLLYRPEAEAVQWLAANGSAGDVVLAPANVSVWMPAYSDLRVVSGHDYETLNYVEKQAAVDAWYKTGQNCQELLATNSVRYVVSQYSPPPTILDAASSSSADSTNTTITANNTNNACIQTLGEPVKSLDGVDIYAIP